MCILAEYPTHTLLPVQGVLSLGLLFHSPLLLETQKGLGGGEKRKGLQGEAPGPGFSLEVKSGQDKSCLSFLLKGGGFSLCFLMPDGRRKGQVIEKSAILNMERRLEGTLSGKSGSHFWEMTNLLWRRVQSGAALPSRNSSFTCQPLFECRSDSPGADVWPLAGWRWRAKGRCPPSLLLSHTHILRAHISPTSNRLS